MGGGPAPGAFTAPPSRGPEGAWPSAVRRPAVLLAFWVLVGACQRHGVGGIIVQFNFQFTITIRRAPCAMRLCASAVGWLRTAVLSLRAEAKAPRRRAPKTVCIGDGNRRRCARRGKRNKQRRWCAPAQELPLSIALRAPNVPHPTCRHRPIQRPPRRCCFSCCQAESSRSQGNPRCVRVCPATSPPFPPLVG